MRAWLTVLLLLTCGCHRYDRAHFPSERAVCSVQLAVPNMACSRACPAKVGQALRTVPGVQSVSVDYGAGAAHVRGQGKACRHEGFEDMLDAIGRLGYKGRIVASR